MILAPKLSTGPYPADDRRARVGVVDSSRLQAIVADQGGLFTTADAHQCGYTDFQIRRRVAAGDWQRILGRVLAPAGRAITPHLVDRAISLALPDGVLAGASAARLHGIPVQTPISCVLTRSKAQLGRPGVRVLRDPVARPDVTALDGLLVTSRARTVFDLLRTLPIGHARDLLDTALQRRWITLPELAARVRAHAGRRDAPTLVGLVRHAADGAQSAAERLAVNLLRSAGLTGWAANQEIRNPAGMVIARGDLVFPAQRLVVEIDGRAHHVSPEQFQRDRERQNRLVGAGWTVLRFTWLDLTRHPHRTVALIRREVEGRSRSDPRI